MSNFSNLFFLMAYQCFCDVIFLMAYFMCSNKGENFH